MAKTKKPDPKAVASTNPFDGIYSKTEQLLLFRFESYLQELRHLFGLRALGYLNGGPITDQQRRIDHHRKKLAEDLDSLVDARIRAAEDAGRQGRVYRTECANCGRVGLCYDDGEAYVCVDDNGCSQ